MIQRNRLRQIREQRGLSQGALGKLIGKDAKYLSKLELGVRSGVTSTTLVRMAVALDVSADYLLGLPDRAAPAPPTTPGHPLSPVARRSQARAMIPPCQSRKGLGRRRVRARRSTRHECPTTPARWSCTASVPGTGPTAWLSL